MNIFQSSPLTKAQTLKQSTEILISAVYSSLLFGITKTFNQIWLNPDQVNLNPTAAWAALGTDAVTVRTAFVNMYQLVNRLVPNSLNLVEPKNYTIVQNQDGSITCTLNS